MSDLTNRGATDPLVIDCDTCEVRGLACDDCVISVLLGAPGSASRSTRSRCERSAPWPTEGSCRPCGCPVGRPGPADPWRLSLAGAGGFGGPLYPV